MLFKITKCPACSKTFAYFRIVRKNKVQPLKHNILFKSLICKKCDQSIGIFKNKKTNQSVVKWIEHESLEEDNLVYHDFLDKMNARIQARVMLRDKRYISRAHEKNLYKKVSSLKKLVDFKTQEEQRKLRADLAIYLKNKQFSTKIKNLIK